MAVSKTVKVSRLVEDILFVRLRVCVLRFLASTQFESVSARKAFPCLDEPALKAIFSMKITAPDGYSVLFNTKVVSRYELLIQF